MRRVLVRMHMAGVIGFATYGSASGEEAFSIAMLTQDAPIPRMDLRTCRNCLMYFNREAQARILARFHFALVPRGVLFLARRRRCWRRARPSSRWT